MSERADPLLRGRAIVPVSIVLLIGLSACSNSSGPSTSVPSQGGGSSAGPGVRTGGPDDPPSLATSPPAPLDGLVATQAPYPQATITDPLVAAREGLRAWAQPTRTYERWWAALAPLLSAAALEAYAGTDPAELPALTVTGTPALTSPRDDAAARDALMASVEVNTSVGQFVVDLTRTDPDAGWLVSRLILPETAGTT